MRRSVRAGIVVLVALGCYVCLLAAAMAVAEQPLSKDDIAVLLRGGSSSEKVIALVEQRGVNFRMDPDIAQRLHNAGASDELIEALQKTGGSVKSTPPGAAATAPETTPAAPSAAATPPAAATPTQTVPVPGPPDAVFVLAGTALGVELQDSLNTKYTQKGDAVSFKVSPEVEIGGRVVIPRDSDVEATVIRAKRGGAALRKGQLQLKFDKIVLPDGTTLPLAAKLTRVGQWNRSNKATLVAASDHDITQDLFSLAQWGLIGAGLGAAIGADAGNMGKGAAIGAGAVAVYGILEILKQRGPDLDLPPGTMFQIELTEPLQVPVASGGGTQLVASSPPPQPSPPFLTGVPAAGGVPSAASAPEPTPETRAPPKFEVPPPPTAPAAASSTTAPPPVPPPPPADTTLAESDSGFTIKMDVNLVMVEATVRDERGAIYIKLKQEDFLVLEDGVKQEIRHFSRDELPLAVALVIDRTGSVAPFMDRLRRAAYETLSQLKAGDQVALFAFAERPERLADLTTEREVIANRVATIQAGGATNINDALYEAAAYLGREAPERRHAIILISDNEHNFNGFADERAVIRTALEAESVVYSIKVQDRSPLSVLAQPIPMGGSGVVKTITRETGGEIFDIKEMGSVESAMQAVVSRLKLRFTLGYQSTNKRRDGAFRNIEVRVTKKEASGFTVYARRGYYAPRPGREEFTQPSPDTYPAVAGPLPAVGGPTSVTEQGKGPSKPFTNEGVLKLVKAGFGEETILEAIRTNECHFDTSADALTALKNAGVSEKIIMAMLAAGRAPGGRSAPSGKSDALPGRAGIYVLRDGMYVPLEIEWVQWRPRGWESTSGSVKTTRLKADMATPESSVQLPGSLEFLLVCPDGVVAAEYQLLRAEPKKKGREFRVEFQSLTDDIDTGTGGTPQTVVILRGRPQNDVTLAGTGKNKVHFTAEPLETGKFRLKLPELANGEYAFLPPTKGLNGRLYTFGVR